MIQPHKQPVSILFREKWAKVYSCNGGPKLLLSICGVMPDICAVHCSCVSQQDFGLPYHVVKESGQELFQIMNNKIADILYLVIS